MIHLQMIYFNHLDEHGNVIERTHRPMDEKFTSREELDVLRLKLWNEFMADGKDVVIRFQYLTMEE